MWDNFDYMWYVVKHVTIQNEENQSNNEYLEWSNGLFHFKCYSLDLMIFVTSKAAKLKFLCICNLNLC